MNEYTKIHTIWKRDERGRIIEGEYSLPEFKYLADNDWVWTEKVDGTNVRIFWEPLTNSVRFGGRTDKAQMPVKLMTALTNLVSANRMLSVFGDDEAILYGEGYGAGIQRSGGNYRSDQSFVLFDVKVGRWWLARDDVVDVAVKLRLDVVPVVYVGPLPAACDIVRHSKLRSLWGDFAPEGLVGKPVIELFSRKGDRVITKIKRQDYAA